MLIQHLPSEVLNLIFQRLSRQDVFICMLVCKPWFIPAVQEYSREINLSKHSARLLRPKLLKKQSLDTRICYWVRKLNLSVGYSASKLRLDPGLFAILLSNFPNLNVVDFNSTGQFEKYQSILQRTAEDHHHIQEISVPFSIYTTQDVMEDYFALCYKLRSSISRLCINYSSIRQQCINGEFGNYLDFLPDFKKLTHLTLYNYPRNNGDSHLCMFSILKTCPHLIHFKFTSSGAITDTVANGELTSMEHESGYLLHDNIHLKNVWLTIPMMIAPYMKYIISHVPMTLGTFDLIMSCVGKNMNFDEWIQGDDYGVTVMKFASHLSRVKNLNIETENRIKHQASARIQQNPNEPILIYDDGVVEQSRNLSLIDEIKRFWRFVGSIKGNRNLDCVARFRIFDDGYKGSPIDVNFNVENNREFDLMYGFNFQGYLHDTTERFPSLSPWHNDRVGLHIIHWLDISVESNIMMAESNRFQLLHDVLYNNPRLHKLHITFVTISSSSPSDYFVHLGPINSICVEHVVVDPSATTQEMIVLAKLRYLSLTTELSTCLSFFVPNIKSLDFSGCDFDFDAHFNTIIELEGLQQLENLTLHMDNIDFSRFRSVFFRFSIRDRNNGGGNDMMCYKSKSLQGKKNAFGKQGYILAATNNKYIQKYNRFTSTTTSVITIHCSPSLRQVDFMDTMNKNAFILFPRGNAQLKIEDSF